MKQVHFFALAVSGEGISGGDRIFIEFARRWSREYPLTIFTSFEGKRLCERQNLQDKNLKISPTNNRSFESLFLLNYIYKIFSGIKLGLTLRLDRSSENIVYSASEFWMDALPAWILKIRYPKINWAAAWYQTAPNPFAGYLWSLPYWLVQLPIKPHRIGD